MPATDRLTRVFAALLRARALILVVYALLIPAAVYEATRIPSEGGIERLIVPSDPDYVTTRAFQKIFPEQQTALLVLEADDPWSPAAIARLDRASAALAHVPHVSTFSVLDVLRRARPGADLPALRALALGTPFFAHQGLVGPHFLTLLASLDGGGSAPAGSGAEGRRGVVDGGGSAPAGSGAEGRRGSVDGGGSAPAGSGAEGRRGSLDGGGSAPAGSGAEGRRGVVDGGGFAPAGSGAEGRRGSVDMHDGKSRDAALAAIDDALAAAQVGPVRRIGEPYVSSWIEEQAAAAQGRSFPIFGALLVVIALVLFRSWRTLLAILISLGGAVALAVAAGGLIGFTFTIVSVLVPLTILVTTLATLVYLQSRFVDGVGDRDDQVSLAEHHLIALRNKFLPVTASTLAAAMGFAALAVSHIRPIREMGIWTAIGLAIAWLVAYTLFPALQRVLRTPTGARAKGRHGWYDRFATALPALTYRWRWPIVGGALLACAAGVAVLVGIPGVVGGTRVEVDALSNIDPASDVAHDLIWFRANVMDLNVARVWIHLPHATATDPEVLRAIDQFQTALEGATDVTGVTGPTTFLRMRSYLAGHGDALPRDADGFGRATADLEQLLLTEPALRTFIDVDGLADLQLTILFRNGEAAGYAAMAARVNAAWAAAVASSPALAGADEHLTGESLLQVKVGASLVPTLAESFILTAALIFVVFLVLFRSGIERLLAMIPSLVALLVTFFGMRVLGGSLNVATIIIATTILGTTENDQIHFFHHMHERAGRPLEERLQHALHVSGRAIVFATLINSVGFFGLAISSFPPLRQFGLMTSAAFLLALVADFTALPAALWIVSREKPAGTRS